MYFWIVVFNSVGLKSNVFHWLYKHIRSHEQLTFECIYKPNKLDLNKSPFISYNKKHWDFYIFILHTAIQFDKHFCLFFAEISVSGLVFILNSFLMFELHNNDFKETVFPVKYISYFERFYWKHINHFSRHSFILKILYFISSVLSSTEFIT